MAPFPIGSVISGISSLVGGLFGRDANKKAAEQNAALQREFAQNGIQWKVEDAKKAGIHPLYALGANTTAASPSYVGDTSFGTGIANAGQDIGRAIDSTRSSSARLDAYMKTMRDLQVQNAALQNEQLAIQNAKLRQVGSAPPMPTSGDRYLVDGQSQSGLDFQAPGKGQGVKLGTVLEPAPWISNAEDTEKRHGEIADMAHGFVSVPSDLAWNYGRLLKSIARDLPRSFQRHKARALPSFFYRD